MASNRLVAVVLACGMAFPGCGKKEPEKGREEEKGADPGGTQAVTLTPEQIKLAEIQTAPAKTGDVPVELSLNGEISLNLDRVVHVVPRVPGIVRSIRKTLGDQVALGEILAVLDSKELAEAKAVCQGSCEKLVLSKANFEREERLWKAKIAPEEDYLNAKRAFSETQIESRINCQKLQALGFSAEYAKNPPADEASPTEFNVASPMAGSVIEKRFAEGERVGEADMYTIADMDHLWLIADVYEKDIAAIRKGQTGVVAVRAYADKEFEGAVTWIADSIDEETRTLKIRLEIGNKDRLLKPGMFGRIALTVETKRTVLSIPAEAIQTDGEQTIAFIDKGQGRFERREVRLGVRARNSVEILEGIEAGEAVVTNGSFTLKSELAKAAFEED